MPCYRRPLFHVVCALSLVSAVAAADLKSVEKQAKWEFYGKTLLMSHPYLNNRLRFSSSGTLIGESEEGTWAMNGIVHVDDIEVRPSMIRVRATREVVILRTQDGKLGLQPILLLKHLEAELQSPAAIATLDDIRNTVGLVFHEENLSRKMNEYWRGLVKITGVNPKNGELTLEGGQEGVYGFLAVDRPVYLPSQKVDPPRPIHKEEAEYTKAASVKKTQGKTFMMVVVNEKGYPEILHLLKDLGDDLDTQTLAATSQWRFRPAMKDGKPVAAVTRVGWEAVTY